MNARIFDLCLLPAPPQRRCANGCPTLLSQSNREKVCRRCQLRSFVRLRPGGWMGAWERGRLIVGGCISCRRARSPGSASYCEVHLEKHRRRMRESYVPKRRAA